MDYRNCYYQLFAATAGAIELLEQNRPQRAKEVLIAAEQKAEEEMISEVETDEGQGDIENCVLDKMPNFTPEN